MTGRDRNTAGRAEQARPRDALGRPLPYGAVGVEPVDDRPRPPDETLRAARELVQQGRAFGAHEVLEGRWKSCPPGERALWQGLAQLCVALTHHGRGNHAGARRIADRGARGLREYAASGGVTHGVDTDALAACVHDTVSR